MHAIPSCFSAARDDAVEILDVEPRAAEKQKVSRGWCGAINRQPRGGLEIP